MMDCLKDLAGGLQRTDGGLMNETKLDPVGTLTLTLGQWPIVDTTSAKSTDIPATSISARPLLTSILTLAYFKSQ